MLKSYKVHPAASAFPRMPEDEFDELKEDIKQHGIRIPILVNKKRDTRRQKARGVVLLACQRFISGLR